jgi:hypothetical protein
MSNPGPANSTWNGLVKERPGGWVSGDGYAVGDDPLREKVKAQAKSQDSDTDSFYSSRSNSRACDSSRTLGNMSRDRYEPLQYGERGYVANDGYARDSRSDYYEQSQYGAGGQAYSREPAYVSVAPYAGARYADQRRSLDDQDVDGYYERTKVTKYRRDTPTDRGLVPYDNERQRARSQGVYPREERRSPSRSRSRNRSAGSSDSERESSNTPAKKWISTFVGAAIGGAAANQVQKGRRQHEGPGWKSTAVGAVIGGVLARELEKVVYEHKDKKRDREHEREGR